MTREELRELAREKRKNPTKAEKLLWYRLDGERYDGLRFRRQFVIHPFIVDFCCLRARVIIELDGWSHDDSFRHDVERQQKLEQEGFAFLRYDNMAVLDDPDSVADSISHYCVQRAKLLFGEDFHFRRDASVRE